MFAEGVGFRARDLLWRRNLVVLEDPRRRLPAAEPMVAEVLNGDLYISPTPAGPHAIATVRYVSMAE